MTAAKAVLITGAGGSLGRAFTRVFARAGYAIAGIEIDERALGRFQAAAEGEGADCLPLHCDLGDWDAVARAVDAAAGRFGRLDLVINNATYFTTPDFKPLEEATVQEFDATFAAGPKGAFGVMRAALPHLKRVKGRVINIGSGTGLQPLAGLAPYAMAKGAIHTLTYAAAKEWGQYGITVNSILPYVMTEKLAAQIEADPRVASMVVPPLGRVGDAERDIGAVALFLASPAADYITGQNIPVNGGHLMR